LIDTRRIVSLPHCCRRQPLLPPPAYRRADISQDADAATDANTSLPPPDVIAICRQRHTPLIRRHDVYAAATPPDAAAAAVTRRRRTLVFGHATPMMRARCRCLLYFRRLFFFFRHCRLLFYRRLSPPR